MGWFFVQIPARGVGCGKTKLIPYSFVANSSLVYSSQVEATRVRQWRFLQKAISDQRGETGCFETCGHTTCAKL